MKTTLAMAACAALVSGCVAQKKQEVPVTDFYNIEAKTITGETIKLEAYKGKVLLIVNTASKCGFTGQFDGLQKLYETYQDKGFFILGFPSNDFLKQDPGTNEEIASFCKLNYGVTFPMFEKIVVKGDGQHPLYTYLTSEQTDPEFAGKISWNFNKFLISRDGKIIGRFGSRTSPDDKKLVEAVKSELSK
jgi:glutathione peroxidase